MLNNATLEKLRYMKLYGMAAAFEEQSGDKCVRELSFEERFGLVVDSEYSKRRNALLQKLIANATFKISSACIENIEYHSDRKLDRELLIKLSACGYIADRRDVIIMGATGAGKTYVGCALGMAACRKFFKVKYIRLPELLTDI
jgi:DNA replication protein DnaC